MDQRLILNSPRKTGSVETIDRMEMEEIMPPRIKLNTAKSNRTRLSTARINSYRYNLMTASEIPK